MARSKSPPPEPTLEWFKDRVDIGSDGKYGIYVSKYNVRLSTVEIQSRLRLLFDRANAPRFDLAKQVAKLGADSLLPPKAHKSRKADKRQNPSARSIRRRGWPNKYPDGDGM